MRIFATACLLLIGQSALACGCLWQGPFNAVYRDADLLVMGVVSSAQGNSIDLQVDEILRGSEHRDEIRIWGKTGELCRPESEDFPVGSQWVMALQRIEEVPDDGFNPFKPNISFGRVADYSLSSCGVNWLTIKGGRVSGNVIDGTRWQYLDAKKTPVLMSVFRSWLEGELSDDKFVEAAKPRKEARELLNNTRLFLKQMQRESDQREQLIEHPQ